MSTKWQGLVQEKLFLARVLFKKADALAAQRSPIQSEDAGYETGLVQGGLALMFQARDAMLVLIAQLNQSKAREIHGLAGLAEALGETNGDVVRLTELSLRRESWWQQLNSLQRWSNQPREPAVRPREDNLIAISAAEGPDLSLPGLLQLNSDMKQYLTELSQWHGEW